MHAEIILTIPHFASVYYSWIQIVGDRMTKGGGYTGLTKISCHSTSVLYFYDTLCVLRYIGLLAKHQQTKKCVVLNNLKIYFNYLTTKRRFKFLPYSSRVLSEVLVCVEFSVCSPCVSLEGFHLPLKNMPVCGLAQMNCTSVWIRVCEHVCVCAFLPHSQCSQDWLRIHRDPDQNKMLTENECEIRYKLLTSVHLLSNQGLLESVDRTCPIRHGCEAVY